MVNKYTLLLVDDDQEWGLNFISELTSQGFEIKFETEAENTLRRINLDKPDAVLLDIMWPAENGGHVNKGKQALEQIKGKHPHLPVIMLTSTMEGDYSDADYRRAAFPYGKDSFGSGEARAYARFGALIRDEIERNRKIIRGSEKYGFIVGKTQAMKEICRKIDIAASTTEPVLVTGETGTGKDLVASAVHKIRGSVGPFVTVNCGAFTETLLESELFGHEKGAFTDARSERKGLFETADRGTLFLDEIADAPRKVQGDLLRVLQSGEIRRVGSDKVIKVNTRVIAATNKNLDEEFKAGRFREDLLYRLKVIEIDVPPLRERKEDIGELAEHFIKIFNERHEDNHKTPKLRKDVLTMLQNYNWPGNIRELENAVYSAALHTRSDWLLTNDFLLKTNQITNSLFLDIAAILNRFKNKEISFKKLTERVSNKSPEMKAILEGICQWCYEKEGSLTQTLLADYLGLNTRANVQRILEINGISTTELKKRFKQE